MTYLVQLSYPRACYCTFASNHNKTKCMYVMYVCKKWHTPQGNGFVSFDYIIFQTLGAIVCFLSQLLILSSLLKPYLPFLKVDIRYNLPTTRDEICKFDVTFTVKETIKQKPGQLFGPVQVKQRNTKGRGNPCKGKKKNKKKCKKGKKRQPPKPLSKKSIQLKVCAR